MPTVTLRPTSDQFFPYAGTNITQTFGQATTWQALADDSDLSFVRLNALSSGTLPNPPGTIVNRGALFIVGMSTASLPANSVIRSVTVKARAAHDPQSQYATSAYGELFVGFADNSRVAEGPQFTMQDDYLNYNTPTPVDVLMSNTAIVTYIGTARAASPNTLGPNQTQPTTGGYYSGGAWTQADIDNLNLSVALDAHATTMTMGEIPPSPVLLYELYADVLYALVPSVTIQAPVGTVITENNPVVGWTFIAGQDGGPQAYYRVKVFTQAQYQAVGFDPWLSVAAWDSTTANSSASSVRIGALLANGTYRAFVFVAASTNGQQQWAISSTAGPYSDFVVAVPGPGAPTISAAATSTAGRVAVTVTKGANPSWVYAQVQRSADGGSTWVDVRDYTLFSVAALTSFVADDYEAPPNTSVVYRARGLSISGGGTAVGDWSSNSNAVSWALAVTTTPNAALGCDDAMAWLKNPLNANQNTLVRLGVGSLLTKDRRITRGLFPVLGRVNPVAVTDVRTSIETTLTILTKTVAEEVAVLALFASANTLLLQAPAAFGWESAYISPGDLTETQVFPNITRPERLFSVPVVVTDAPAGVSTPVVTPSAPPPPPPPGSGPPPASPGVATTAIGVGTANNPTATESVGGGGASAYPTNASTGVPTGTSLTTINVGSSVWRTSTDGSNTTEVIGSNTYKVWTAKNFTGSTGYMYLDDPYVKFVNCRFTWTGLVSNQSAMVQGSASLAATIVNDCSFDGGAAFHNRGFQSDYGHMTFLRCNFTRNGEACIEHNDRSGLGDLTVTDSYFTEVKGWPPGTHTDGIQVDGSHHVTIQHNTIWIEPYGGTNGDTGYVSNSCMGVWSTLAAITGNVLIENNQMAGGGTCIYMEQQSYSMQGTVTVNNNRFDRTHFPSLQGAQYNPTSGHAAVWYVLYPGGRPASLVGAGSGWTNNKYEDGSTVTLTDAITST